MSIDDLPIQRTPGYATPDPPPASSPSPWRWILVALGGVAAGAALMFWWMSRAEPTPAAPPSPAVLDDVSASNRPKRQPIDLPALDASDELLRSLVATLSAHPTFARLLATKGLVRAGVLATVQIGDGRTPAELFRPIRPTRRVTTTEAAGGPIDPESYTRWEAMTTALTSVSPANAAQVYVNIKPIIDEAYIELGATQGDFDRAIVRAIQMLASTPQPAEPPALAKRGAAYDFQDPDLRALKPVQKQFLLMGAAHQRRVVSWLQEFARALDLTI